MADYVANFRNHAEPVMEQLIKGGPHRAVVSIVGMGGLGKTTLARRIYNDPYTKKQFSCCAWVFVSPEFLRRDLLLYILRSMMVMMPSSTEEICDHYQMMNESELEKELKQFLANKKYLIVLDDVWDTEVWDGIKSALPDNLSGSRVLISSRFASVASHASSILTYFLPLLNKDDSWKLFLKKAFHGKVCPSPKLEEKGRRIVEKCNGLPLAITVAAACLFGKCDHDSPSEWSLMEESLSSYLRRDPAGNFFDVLTLSYKQLHSHLKPCFLYFGVFPEGFEIPARRLIRLWIAEGFIKPYEHTKVEDVAEDYLEDLIDGSLIAVVKRRSDGGVKSCSCIHNLLRDICVSKGLQENFLALDTDHEIIDLPSGTTSTSTRRPRILSIHSTASRYISSVPYDTHGVRALLCFEDQDELNIESFRSIYKGFHLLKVLDLGSIIVHKVPNQVEKLVHIRYMRMNAPDLIEIPSYISNLSLIQTLDLRESKVTLTQNFWVMQQLRHLFLSRLTSDVPISLTAEDKPSMLNLQTLSIVSPSIICLEDINGNPMFPNLTKLGLLGGSSFPVHMQTIKTLKFVGDRSYRINPNAFSTSLTKVTFMKTKLKSSDFAVVAELPNLCILKLVKSSVPILECSEDAFPKLQVLHFGELDVRKWTIESGSMRSLRYLFIGRCQELTEIPDQLKHVTTLRHVKASWISSRLERSIRKLGKNVKLEFDGYKEGGWGT